MVEEKKSTDKSNCDSNENLEDIRIDVIIDGNNVAFDNVPKGESPRCKNIELALEYYSNQDMVARVIVDASLRHMIDEKNLLKKALDNMLIAQSPAGVQADEYILKLALIHPEFKIVSNDTFDDWIRNDNKVFERIKKELLSKKERLIKFKINGQFIEFKNG